MKRRAFLSVAALAATLSPVCSNATARSPACRGTGDLGVVIERATGSILIIDNTQRGIIGRVEGLGDLSHASVVFSRDQRFAYIFGRDGGLSKVDILNASIEKRVIQGGNAIGGAISDDGALVAVSNYEPGGIRIFDARTLEQVADIPAVGAGGVVSKTVGLVDIPGRRFVYCLFEAGEIWIADCSTIGEPVLTKFPAIGELPYDANVTSDGRHYFAGLFGEDGLTHLDLWADVLAPKRIFKGYNAGREKLPVYKMPHMEGWAQTGAGLVLPAVGQNEVLMLDISEMKETARIPVHGQPVFCVARPDGREVWINFAHPKNDTVQILDVMTRQIVHQFAPGPAVLHLEFTSRGHEVWISVRDENRVDIMDVKSRTKIGEIPANSPSGIFFTPRAHRIGG